MGVLRWEVDGAVATMTMNDRDRRNALSAELRHEMTERFEEFDLRPDLRVLIIAGDGPVFCAGGDLAEMPTDTAQARIFLGDILAWLQTPERLSKPVIAAVDGAALGGGLELAIACDIIVASERATFGTPESLVGLAPAFAMVRLQHLIGAARTKQLAFTGRALRAEEAQRVGMVSEVVDAALLMPRSREIAHEMLRGAPLAQALLKSVVNREMAGAQIAHARDGMVQLFLSDDAREGISAFREKRAPVFTGR